MCNALVSCSLCFVVGGSDLFLPEPDLVASVQHIHSHGVFLSNTFRLSGTTEQMRPEHFVDQVEKALPKDRKQDSTSSAAAEIVQTF